MPPSAPHLFIQLWTMECFSRTCFSRLFCFHYVFLKRMLQKQSWFYFTVWLISNFISCFITSTASLTLLLFLIFAFIMTCKHHQNNTGAQMSPVTTATTSCYQAFWDKTRMILEGWRARQIQEASSAEQSETTWSLNTDVMSLIHWAKCHNIHHNCSSPEYWTHNLSYTELISSPEKATSLASYLVYIQGAGQSSPMNPTC